MKNVAIGCLAGLLISKSNVWVYADTVDRVIIAVVAAALVIALVDYAEDELRQKRMREWRIKRIIRNLHEMQNRP